mmetsp:Transcript_89051/g.147911  ORF Transcript_89051/g.147911 Transcript_89051/m.147911 type:complete len:84 (+) Transcript_89051:200-451(+)
MMMMRLQFLMLDRRCATVMTVMLPDSMISSNASWTSFSHTLSRALVASSSSRIEGLRMMQRAMAIRCFCPPLSCEPLRPTFVS